MQCSEKDENARQGFSSCFLSFESRAQIEIMTRENISNEIGIKVVFNGLSHFALSVGLVALYLSIVAIIEK